MKYLKAFLLSVFGLSMLEIHAQIPRTVSWTYEGTFIGKSMNLHQVVDHPDNGWYFLLSDVKGGANNDYDAVVLHLDSTGQYVHHFSPARPGNPNGDPVFAKDIVVKENGNVLILAITAEETEGDDYGNPTLFEYTPAGERLWFDGYPDQGIYREGQTTEDLNKWKCLILNNSDVVLSNFRYTGENAGVIKKYYGPDTLDVGFIITSGAGNEKFILDFGGSEADLILSNSGLRGDVYNVLIGTNSNDGLYSNTFDGSKLAYLAVDNSGEVVDSNFYQFDHIPGLSGNVFFGSNYNDHMHLGNGNVFCSGSWQWRYNNKPPSHHNTEEYKHDGFAFMLNDTGLVWFKSYGGTGIDKFQDAIKLNNGNILLVGHSSSNDGDLEGVAHVSNVWLTEIDTDGNIIDQFRFPIQDYGLISPQLWKVRQAANGDIILGFRTSNYGGFVALALSDNLTGVRSQSRNSPTMIYPNPAASEIYVSGVDSSQDFYIYSVEGSLVIEGVLDSDNKTIDIQQLPSGFYYFKMGNAQIKRFIKK